jgi:hypothetical protein
MKRAFKTIERLKKDNRIEDAWDEGEDGYWAILKRGFVDKESGAHALHESTAKSILFRIRYIAPCTCQDCLT